MKKLKLWLLLILFIPITVLADSIENFYYNVTILENGDLEVEEYFNLEGYYNGMEREINFFNSAPVFDANLDSYGGSSIHNGKDIILEEIKGVEINNEFDFQNVIGDEFVYNSDAVSGDYGYYTYSANFLTGKKFKIFLPSRKNKAFYLKYRLVDMAILHNDIGELGWNIFNNNFTEDIRNLKVTINIPNNKNIIKIWGHGPLNGEAKILDVDKAEFTINNLDANTAIDVRLAFDKEVIFNSSKKTGVDALTKIINYETDLALKTNEERERIKTQKIAEIEESFQKLDDFPSRYSYNNLLDKISNLEYLDLQQTYMNRLLTYQDKVDDFEYDMFTSYIKEGTFFSYEQACDIVNLVFNENLKNEMQKELEVYKEEVYQHEYFKEKVLIAIAIAFIIISIIARQKSKISGRFIKNISPKYNRNIPNNLSPVEAGILIDRCIDGKEISATLLDLIKRKIIKLTKDKKGYLLSLNVEKETLTFEDKKIVQMIFKGRKSVSLKKIRRIEYNYFESWKKHEINMLVDKKLITKKSKKIKSDISILWLILGIFFFLSVWGILIGIAFLTYYGYKRYHENIYLYFILVASVILIFVSLIFNHIHISLIFSIIAVLVIKVNLSRMPQRLEIELTDKGKEEVNKLYALRNFLNDFSILDEKEIKEIVLWEDYLIYATLFGISKKVIKNMKLKIDNPEILNENILFDVAMLNFVSTTANSISNVTNRYAIPSVHVPLSGGSSSSSSSSYSSGSGSGGGFSGGSSGGGSFGGGSGGGRF